MFKTPLHAISEKLPPPPGKIPRGSIFNFPSSLDGTPIARGRGCDGKNRRLAPKHAIFNLQALVSGVPKLDTAQSEPSPAETRTVPSEGTASNGENHWTGGAFTTCPLSHK